MRLVFRDCQLDEDLYELRRGGVTVPLHPKPQRLLVFLIRNRHRVVPKAELLDQVWPDAVVSDAALSTALKAVRIAVGDDGSTQHVIRTYRGRGYRFVLPVRERQARPSGRHRRRKSASQPPIAAVPPSDPQDRHKKRSGSSQRSSTVPPSC